MTDNPDHTVPEKAGEAEASTPRRRRRLWTIGLPSLAVVVVAACVAGGLWYSDRAAADDAAAEDAAALIPALADARDAQAELADDLTLAHTYLEKTAEPMNTAVAAHAKRLGQKQATALDEAVDDLSALVKKIDPGAVPATDVFPTGADEDADTVAERYRHLHGQDRQDARSHAGDEVARLEAQTDDAHTTLATLHDAVDAVDEAAVDVATAATAAGRKSAKGLTYADTKAKKKVDASVKAMKKLSKTTLPLPWEAHADADGALAGLGDQAATLAKAEAAAEKSEKANTPPPPSTHGGSGGSGSSGGSGGSQSSLCYRYTPWGPPYSELVPC